MLKYCLDRYKTQEMCDKEQLMLFYHVPDLFISSKMIKKLNYDLFCNDDIIFVNEESNNITFLVMKWLFLVQILIILTLMMLVLINTETIIHVRRMAWRNRFKQCKVFKKYISKKLMSIAQHPTRWQDWCMTQDKIKSCRGLTDKTSNLQHMELLERDFKA